MVMSVNDVQYANALREQYAGFVEQQNQQGSEFTAHLVLPGDDVGAEDAAIVLGEAFSGKDPVFSHLQEVGGKSAPLKGIFEYLVSASIDHGGSPVVAYRDGVPVAASLYELPGMRPESTVYTLRHGGPPTIATYGIRGALRALSAVTDVDREIEAVKSSLSGPVIYLNYIGVRPDFRGTGAIHTVADPALRLADSRIQLPIALVSSNRDNVDSFRKAGYEAVSETHYDKDRKGKRRGPILDNMVRRPKQRQKH